MESSEKDYQDCKSMLLASVLFLAENPLIQPHPFRLLLLKLLLQLPNLLLLLSLSRPYLL